MKESYNGQPNAQGLFAVGPSARRAHNEGENLGLAAQPVIASRRADVCPGAQFGAKVSTV